MNHGERMTVVLRRDGMSQALVVKSKRVLGRLRSVERPLSIGGWRALLNRGRAMPGSLKAHSAGILLGYCDERFNTKKSIRLTFVASRATKIIHWFEDSYLLSNFITLVWEESGQNKFALTETTADWQDFLLINWDDCKIGKRHTCEKYKTIKYRQK